MAGRPCKTYCCSYYHDGSWWAIDITAYDWADAEVRAKKMSMRLDGELYMTIPYNVPASGLFVRSLCWIKNALAKIQNDPLPIDQRMPTPACEGLSAGRHAVPGL